MPDSSNPVPSSPPASPSQELGVMAAEATARLRGMTAADQAAEPAVNPAMLLLFLRVGRRWFAVRAETVREVGTKGHVTRVPTAPIHVLGVTLIRGRLVPVLALEGLLGELGDGEVAPTLPRLVVLKHEETEIALVADETRGVIEHRFETVADEGRSAGRPAYLGSEFQWEGKLVCMIDVPPLISQATPGAGRPF